MSISIRDVAKHAGVSIATVSHVINNTRFVTEDTRKKVQASIDLLGYRPNEVARSFKTGRHNMIAFITPDIANPYYSAIIEEVESIITSKGYRLLICNTKEDSNKEADILSMLANGVVDGFIIASTFLTYEPIKSLIPKEIPLVFVDRDLGNTPFDTILIDNSQAIKDGVEYLISQGHTNIAYLTVDSQISTVIERYTAYNNTMQIHHLSTDNLVFYANPLSRSFSENLSPLLRDDISAIIVPNSTLSSEALAFLEKHHKIPGQDVEFIGYKECNQPQYIHPNISLISQPSELLGKVAGQQLLKRIESPSLPSRQINFSASFISKNEIV